MGITTVAAAAGVAPVTALVFNDPIVKKMLEAALGTFIGAVLVEAGTVGIDIARRSKDTEIDTEMTEFKSAPGDEEFLGIGKESQSARKIINHDSRISKGPHRDAEIKDPDINQPGPEM